MNQRKFFFLGILASMRRERTELNTGEGLVELECLDGATKQTWVHDVQKLLRRAADKLSDRY